MLIGSSVNFPSGGENSAVANSHWSKLKKLTRNRFMNQWSLKIIKNKSHWLRQGRPGSLAPCLGTAAASARPEKPPTGRNTSAAPGPRRPGGPQTAVAAACLTDLTFVIKLCNFTFNKTA